MMNVSVEGAKTFLQAAERVIEMGRGQVAGVEAAKEIAAKTNLKNLVDGANQMEEQGLANMKILLKQFEESFEEARQHYAQIIEFGGNNE